MKRRSTIFGMIFSVMLAGCSVEIAATNATAQKASPADIKNDLEGSTAFSDGAGTYVLITANVTKRDVRRVSRREVYPHVHIVECSSGLITNVGTDPRLEGISFSDFNAVDRILKAHPEKQIYEMQSLIFARQGYFHTPQCLQFWGGSYTGQKIVEARLPIRPFALLP
jgi:hypothetical protein